MLKVEHDQHVERGETHAPDERQPEQQIQRDRRAERAGELGDDRLARVDRAPAAEPDETVRPDLVVLRLGGRLAVDTHIITSHYALPLLLRLAADDLHRRHLMPRRCRVGAAVGQTSARCDKLGA